MKVCFKCNENKDLSMFYKHSQMKDGHLNKCIECTKLDVHTRQHGAGREKVIAYDKKRYAEDPARKAACNGYAKKWSRENPKKRAAQYAVSNAVRSGKLIPLPCFICGIKAEAHHPDYDQPLSVVWLCPSHHKQAHALVKK